MSVSGLVVILNADPERAQRAYERLHDDQRLVVGLRFGQRVAISADTCSVEADRALIDELRCIPGIEQVDVVFVGLDDCAAHDLVRSKELHAHDHR